MDRWIIEEWRRYNFAAGSFHTKKLCSRLYRQKLDFTDKSSKIAFMCHSLGDLGVTYTAHLWLVGKRVVAGRLPVGANWTFSPALTVSAMSSYWSRLWCSKGGWVTLSANFRGEWGRVSSSPSTTLCVRKLESLGYHVALFAWSYV